ncbi:MAG TPA: hypothetical protein VN841_11920 [Bryobacteraceae bacterium]|nr:hypothetical protein [Bryobacteraceae bacterium]
MDTSRITRALVAAAALTALLCWGVLGQDAPSPDAQAKDAQSRDTKGLPPRATPGDYQAHAQAGTVTIAAEFKGHSVPTPEAAFTTEDYVTVEVGLFGPPEARVTLSQEDFTLRINAGKSRTKKSTPVPIQPYALVFKDLKDPEWVPPVPVESKSKTSIGGGGGGQGDPPPATPKMPFELVRAMQQRVQKAVLPEGERALPVAGLIFFSYHGKTASIRDMDLIYSGPAGKASLTLQP